MEMGKFEIKSRAPTEQAARLTPPRASRKDSPQIPMSLRLFMRPWDFMLGC
jgi:hypothetical protein